MSSTCRDTSTSCGGAHEVEVGVVTAVVTIVSANVVIGTRNSSEISTCSDGSRHAQQKVDAIVTSNHARSDQLEVSCPHPLLFPLPLPLPLPLSLLLSLRYASIPELISLLCRTPPSPRIVVPKMYADSAHPTLSPAFPCRLHKMRSACHSGWRAPRFTRVVPCFFSVLKLTRRNEMGHSAADGMACNVQHMPNHTPGPSVRYTPTAMPNVVPAQTTTSLNHPTSTHSSIHSVPCAMIESAYATRNDVDAIASEGAEHAYD